jgi:hypothetical protein
MARRGVHEPPGNAARGLLSWALDLWPYVNGKATYQGIDLEELDGPILIDVIHYLFEEDNSYRSGESGPESVSSMRTHLYRTMYNKEYKYAVKGSSRKQGTAAQDFSYDTATDDTYDAPVKPFSPRDRDTVKPYIPPTNVDANLADPLGGVLGPPLK